MFVPQRFSIDGHTTTSAPHPHILYNIQSTSADGETRRVSRRYSEVRVTFFIYKMRYLHVRIFFFNSNSLLLFIKPSMISLLCRPNVCLRPRLYPPLGSTTPSSPSAEQD